MERTRHHPSKNGASTVPRQFTLGDMRDEGRRTNKSNCSLEDEIKKEKQIWTRSAPADLFYHPTPQFSNEFKSVCGTSNLNKLCDEFEKSLLKKASIVHANLQKYEPRPKKEKICCSTKKHDNHHMSVSDSSDSDSSEDCSKDKKNYPLRLHQELQYNKPGELNTGPLCHCSPNVRLSGVRHNVFVEKSVPPCNPNSNNADKLYHYRITFSPTTNFLVKSPTVIEHDEHEYIFEGFSMFSHKKLDQLPYCKVVRFNIEYTIVYYEESSPQNFTIKELDMFYSYLFQEVLELVDLDFRATGDPGGCPQYHFMPRFVRALPGNGKEILPMNEVLRYLLQSTYPLISKDDLFHISSMSEHNWHHFTDNIIGMIVTNPGMKPCSLRVDQLDRDHKNSSELKFPLIVHFGMRPYELFHAENHEYNKARRECRKFKRHLATIPKPSFDDKIKLESKELKLKTIKAKCGLKRKTTVTISSENFLRTGIKCDIVQHALMIPVLVAHLRAHQSLDVLEEKIKYKFNNRFLLQQAMTHPCYRENFGTNPDHIRNSLNNCGVRQPVYGDFNVQSKHTGKRGLKNLMKIMSQFGRAEEVESQIAHNERLEFLGYAVVEFITSVHVFRMFPSHEEGGLTSIRTAIVQNQRLTELAKVLCLDQFMLYSHSSDLCHDLNMKYATANCFKALMGALFLDGGIEVADKVFGETLWYQSNDSLNVWEENIPHPLQEHEPLGDRQWISKYPWLEKLTKFEEQIGVQFTHIRLLARAFTDRSVGYTDLTLGSNQRLEFLGDTVLQLIASEYLYKHFPEHHEGHLIMLRNSLVNNQTQAVVCNDLDLTRYARYSDLKTQPSTKDRADLVEALIGALYLDKGMEECRAFCSVYFFPRLHEFIMNQDWNSPKSKLQHHFNRLHIMKDNKPLNPVYKVIERRGPDNACIHTVAVYFNDKRLAEASGSSVYQAEVAAAKKALESVQSIYPLNSNQNQRSWTEEEYTLHPKRNLNSHRWNSDNKEIQDQEIHKTECKTPPVVFQKRYGASKCEFNKETKCEEEYKGRNCYTSKSNDLRDIEILKIEQSSNQNKRSRREEEYTPSSVLRGNYDLHRWSSNSKETRDQNMQKTTCKTPPVSFQKRYGASNCKSNEETKSVDENNETYCYTLKSNESRDKEMLSIKPLRTSVGQCSTKIIARALSPQLRSKRPLEETKISPNRSGNQSKRSTIPVIKDSFERSQPSNNRYCYTPKSNDVRDKEGLSIKPLRKSVSQYGTKSKARASSPKLRLLQETKTSSNRSENQSKRLTIPVTKDSYTTLNSQPSTSYRRSPFSSPRRERKSYFSYCKRKRRSYSSSPERKRSSRDREDIQKNMMDFMFGKRSSPGLETKSQDRDRSLIDFMFDQVTSNRGSNCTVGHNNPVIPNTKPDNSDCDLNLNASLYDCHFARSSTSSNYYDTDMNYLPPNNY